MSERLHHAGLSVGDLDAAIAWYRRALGFQVEFSFVLPPRGGGGPPGPEGGKDATFEIPVMRGAMMVNQAGVRIELLERTGSGGGPRGSDPDTALLTRGWGHIALEVQDLESTYRRLVEAGASGVWEPRPSPQPGVRMAFVHDPEGNLVELIERGV
jgi:catechol 2,3-dioxygenase-like lactoylglutathione lyase family enzyme